MMTLIRGFLRRPPPDRSLLSKAFAMHAFVALLLPVIRFGRLSRWLGVDGTRLAGGGGQEDFEAVARVAWAVRRATAAAPWGRTCLSEALTAAALIKRTGCDVRLRYGVMATPEHGLAAHAWLEYRGIVVIGDTVEPYAALRPARSLA